jgi:hypothetical protein
VGKRPSLALRGIGLPEPSPRTAQADLQRTFRVTLAPMVTCLARSLQPHLEENPLSVADPHTA